jgi:hypothetical protein
MVKTEEENMSSDFRNNAGFKILQEVAARAIVDDNYRQDLVDNPNVELEKAGLQVPDGVTVVIHENTSSELHMVLPSAVGECPPVPPSDVNVVTVCALTHMF